MGMGMLEKSHRLYHRTVDVPVFRIDSLARIALPKGSSMGRHQIQTKSGYKTLLSKKP